MGIFNSIGLIAKFKKPIKISSGIRNTTATMRPIVFIIILKAYFSLLTTANWYETVFTATPMNPKKV